MWIVSPTQRFEHLHLDQLTIVIPGDADYPLTDGIVVRGLNHLLVSATVGIS